MDLIDVILAAAIHLGLLAALSCYTLVLLP
jgi:hypothetical protein